MFNQFFDMAIYMVEQIGALQSLVVVAALALLLAEIIQQIIGKNDD